MDRLFIGLSIDKENHVVVVETIINDYYDAIENTADRAQNRVQKVFELSDRRGRTEIINWLSSNNIDNPTDVLMKILKDMAFPQQISVRK